ncbi:MAG: hypothetical protein Q7U91_05855 [Sideroxyarcus sp.]|nr:hypothetical protein [Sideroxyarcus sp.]
MKTIQSTNKTEETDVLAKTRSAILEGGYDDLAAAAKELSARIGAQHPPAKDKSVSALVKPLIVVADILATDGKYLRDAIAAYGDAAFYSTGRDEDLNKLSVTGLIELAESLPTPAERIEAYQLALQESPASSPVSALAKHKETEQKDPAYFKMRTPKDQPRLEESVVEGDLRVVSGDGIACVIRHQAPTGVIYYSVVVTRGFSRENLTKAGVQNAQDLVRTKVDDKYDRILIPAHRLPQQTQRDIDFMSRLKQTGIYIDAIHGRTRDATGAVNCYKISEGANPDRMRYMGIDAHAIIPHDGKIAVPIEKIKFHADPALIGKWNWLPAAGGTIKSCVPRNEQTRLIQALLAHGIGEDKVKQESNDYIVVAKDAKKRLNTIIHQHILQERSKNLLNFAEALPASANDIAVAAYKDACGFLFGLRNSR